MTLTDRRVTIAETLVDAQALRTRALLAAEAATQRVTALEAQLALLDDLLAQEVPPSPPSEV